MELNQDERGRQYLKANFGIDDIRLMYDALNHLYDNSPGEPHRHTSEHKRLEKMKSTFYSMLMEYTLHQG